ncbi:type II secretion system F family protein [Amycolatopsis rhabdoformis]|uniref:Type II secretion system F family protein n=1 Tax=Amycolatopsis rhabdoformis TaxID=1448059 RepID=A0ABZ1I071_9PSEU|nr:type II secretion system F family protein [Amycolatopsis rhabdoformis]WSE27779.1 type II secretion system F family protein [Amycolatopsis rhabdoformis]
MPYLLMAAALLSWPSPPKPRTLAPPTRWQPKLPSLRATHALAAGIAGVSVSVVAGLVGGALAAAGAWWLLRRSRKPKSADDVAGRLDAAATLDLLGACLRAGLPVPTALDAVSTTARPPTSTAMKATANLLALGAEPAEAWAQLKTRPGFEELSVAATRTARSGAALAATADEVSRRLRDGIGVEAEERAERAGVALALPVGLCFLPAFFVLGVLPVVLGLAERIGSVL